MDQVNDKVAVETFAKALVSDNAIPFGMVDTLFFNEKVAEIMQRNTKVFTDEPSTQTATPKPTPKWKMFLYHCQYWLEKKTEPVRNKLIKALGGYTEDEAYGDYL